MNRNFNIAEILESVNSFSNADNKHSVYDKKEIINRHKRFTNKNTPMLDNPDAEKIILDAEKLVKEKKKDEKIDIVDTAKPKKQKNIKLDIESNEPLNQPDQVNKNDKVSFNQEDNKSPISYTAKPLILDNEVVEENKSDLELNNSEEENASEEIEEENNLKELENNYIYINDKLKSENEQKEEKIKDLDLLVNKFLNQKKYINLNKSLKLYQEDNAELRKRIFKLSNREAALRLQISNLNLDKQTRAQKNEKLEQSTETEKEDIKELNIKIEDLSQKINQMGTELLELRKNGESQPMDIDQKIKFYREENAKIIVDKSDIEKKLENTKNQLAINENNKRKLRAAVDNLNKILVESNIESSTFINKIEEQATNTNPIIDSDKTKEE